MKGKTMSRNFNLDLKEMLEYRRPGGSKTEEDFIDRYISSIPEMTGDEYGNLFYVQEGAETLISVHTDTVHKEEGMQQVSKACGMYMLPTKSKSNCLGADDTAGVYAALKMIEAGVTGVTFAFHRMEEKGGRGSSWLAENYTEWLRTFKRCVALDRRGMGDVITHQSWERGCSEKFALELCGALGMGHTPVSGIFTDSANYMHIIPECSNISVGYDGEHTKMERLSIGYLERLLPKLIELDWNGLGTYRDPAVVEKESWVWDGWDGQGWGNGWRGTEGKERKEGKEVAAGGRGGVNKQEWWEKEPLAWCMECGWEALFKFELEEVELEADGVVCPECGKDAVLLVEERMG